MPGSLTRLYSEPSAVNMSVDVNEVATPAAASAANARGCSPSEAAPRGK
jgi:hypothetical protein